MPSNFFRILTALSVLVLSGLVLGAPPAAAGQASAEIPSAVSDSEYLAAHSEYSAAVEHAFGETVLQAGHKAIPFQPPSAGALVSLERQPLEDNLAWYRLELQVGPGQHERIALHRVVRERAAWFPAPAARGAFMVHGDAWGFAATYLANLAAPAVPARQSPAVFLANAGVDVWGIDLRGGLVPAETTDFAFMADWGFETNLNDLDLALAAARWIRLATGSGFSKLNLLGFSRGGQLGWALLNTETQRPEGLRHVGGFVAVENFFKTSDEALRESNCAAHADLEAQIAAGTWNSDFRAVTQIGDLAITDPDEPSPFFAALGNADLAEWIGASAAGGTIPHLHSVGGLIDPMTLETELLYTRPELWFAFLASVSPYQPLAIDRDGAAIVCDGGTPFDDHLGAIDVPVFYLGVAGAFGELGLHTLGLIASEDVSSQIVSLAEDREQDLGHNEVFLAEDAEVLVWQPILEWISSR